MGYFIEGHVSPEQLRQLAKQKPAALGVKRDNPPEADSGLPTPAPARKLLINKEGEERVWTELR